jgi:hypothetical protein
MLFVIHGGQSKYLKSQGISNLRLASRAARGGPVFPFSAALRAAEQAGKNSLPAGRQASPQPPSFLPALAFAAAEFRISLCEMRR